MSLKELPPKKPPKVSVDMVTQRHPGCHTIATDRRLWCVLCSATQSHMVSGQRKINRLRTERALRRSNTQDT